jgi:hypothetical protein
MTGDFTDKERVVVSRRMLAPARTIGDVDKKALTFKASVIESAKQERLIADIAVKALGENRQTYEDTDNKKREFTGDTRPGVQSDEFGHRWETAAKWEPGKRFVLSPSYESKNGMDTMPNIGWIEPTTGNFKNLDEMLFELNRKPQIKLTKFKVNAKTDDVIQESAEEIDGFSITAGMSFDERRAKLRELTEKENGLEKKRLPGRPLSSRIPGGNLIARAAARFGVVRDELNKFRCPPGTPAANQFTDMFGTNCFGFSASRFSRFAARKAKEMQESGELGGFTNGVRTLLNFIKNNEWDSNVPWAPVRMARSPYYDEITGERLDSPDWRTVDVEPGQRLFRNGLINAQDAAIKFDESVSQLYSELGVDRSDAARAVNADVFEAVEKLNELFVATGGRDGWDLNVSNVSGMGDMSRMRPDEVRRYITARLQKVANWKALTKPEQERLIEADIKRYYETERAYFETALHLYKTKPGTAKFFDRIEYNFFTNDEAGTAVHGSMRPGAGGIRGVMHVNLERIMTNQESMLPDMRADERLAVSAVGVVSDSEAKSAVADFLINSEYAARHMAGLIDGPRSFTKHIAFHEFSHGIQSQAFIQKILRKAIDNGGKIEIPQYKQDKRTGAMTFVGNRIVTVDFDEERGGLLTNLTSGDVMDLMMDSNDGLDLKNMSDALKRSEVAAFLAGKYPTEYTEGSEIWGLEVGAELHALREQGLIFGDDVDAALEWMDDVERSRLSAERADIDAEERAILESTTFRPTSSSSADRLSDEEIDEMSGDIEKRTIEERREKLKEFKKFYSELDEEEMFQQAALVDAQRRDIRAQLDNFTNELNGLSELPEDATEESITERIEKVADLSKKIEEGQKILDYYEKMYSDSRSEWRKKFGVGAKGEASRFDRVVEKTRRDAGMVDDEEIKAFAKAKRIDDITSSAKTKSENQLIRRAADIDVLVKDRLEDDPEVQELMEERSILRSEYISRIAESGDSRATARAGREFNGKVDELLKPKPKKIKKFKSQKEAIDNAKREKARLRRKITKEQAAAIREMDDFVAPEIAQMLTPEKQTVVGRAMNARNARLNRLGLAVDPRRKDEGSLSEQVRNILIPTMEAIDSSSIDSPFEFEVVSDFPAVEVKGKKVGDEINVDNFISGRVLTSRSKPTSSPRGTDKETGRVKRKIIISVAEGNRGVFPNAEKDDEQKFVAPPGKLRIISRDKDGTIRAEIVRQKDTVDVLDALVDGISSGTDDAIWRQGNSKKIREVADKEIIRRSKLGISRPDSTERESADIDETSAEIIDSVADFGSTFGEAPSRRLSSGSTHFGPTLSREERRSSRRKQLSSDMRELRSILNGNGSKEYDDIASDMLDSNVAEALRRYSDEQIAQLIENAAFKMHSSFDRRVRVRMRDEDISSLSENGVVRSGGVRPGAPSTSRRTERLSRMAPNDRRGRLSSGRISSVEELESRAKLEDEVAAKAADIFDKVVAGGKNVDDMTTDEISKVFGKSLVRSTRKAISAKHKNTYIAEDVPTALALMSLGHHVIVKDADLTLTASAQAKLEKAVQKSALTHIEQNNERWLNFKKAYEADVLSNNPSIDISSKDFVNKMKKDYVDSYQADLCGLYDAMQNLLCSGHIGIDREKMPQTNGRTKGANTIAIRMLKNGKADGKWEPASGLSTEDSERYASLKKRHPMKNKPSSNPMSEDELNWFYSNTDWNNTEVNLEGEFIQFLNETLTPEDPSTGPSVRKKTVPANEYAPSQQQLVASKVSGMADGITKKALEIADQLEQEGLDRKSDEFRRRFLEEINKQWFSSPILATMDKYILDGHHRWAGINVANLGLGDELQVPLNVNEVQTDIVEGLTLGRAFQEVYGIKEARLGAENAWQKGDIAEISDSEIAKVAEDLKTNISDMADELYERGDFIKVGAVGYTARPDYKKAVTTRQSLRSNRRIVLPDDSDEITGRAAARRTWFSSGRDMTSAASRARNDRNANARAVSALTKAGVEKSERGDMVQAIAAMSVFGNGGTSEDIAKVANQIAAAGNQDLALVAVRELQRSGAIDKNTAMRAMEKLGDYSGPRKPVSNRKKLQNSFADGFGAFMKNVSEKRNNNRTRGVLSRTRRQVLTGKMSDGDTDATSSQRIGMSAINFAKDYQSSIGLSSDIPNELRPVSGYLVHNSYKKAKQNQVLQNNSGNIDMDANFEIMDEDIVGDGLTAFGDIEVVLKPNVSNRVAYGKGDSLSTGHRPVALNSMNRDDIVDAYIGGSSPGSRSRNLVSTLNLLGAGMSDDFSSVNSGRDRDGKFPTPGSLGQGVDRDIFEAQILGGFDKDEVEKINYPFSRLSENSGKEDISDVVNNRSIAERLRSAGFSQEEIEYFYSINSGSKMNTQSMQKLRNYRAAKKIQDEYKKLGFDNVGIAHPEGINLFDARSYSAAAKRSDDIETVLREKIMREIAENAKKLLEEMRKEKSPSLVTRSGAML